jgi:hypothetical protein
MLVLQYGRCDTASQMPSSFLMKVTFEREGHLDPLLTMSSSSQRCPAAIDASGPPSVGASQPGQGLVPIWQERKPSGRVLVRRRTDHCRARRQAFIEYEGARQHAAGFEREAATPP